MLTRHEILHFLKQYKQEFAARFSVRTIGLFGSFLHDNASERSDIDILVTLEKPTFDHYMDLKFFLEDHLKRPVDLVIEDTVKPRLKPIIEREVEYA